MLCSWPFSLKILWAPIVDSVYSSKFGRRKTWLVPIQFLIAAGLFFTSEHIHEWLQKLEMVKLTTLMFFMYFLAATQDIATDGWALTMLEAKGWASVCNTVGQSLGVMIASTGYFLLSSHNIIELPGFLQLCSLCFLVITTLVAIFIKERPTNGKDDSKSTSEDTNADMWKVYAQMMQVTWLPNVRELLAVLFTWKMGFSCTDSALYLKFQEIGFSKESVTYMKTLMSPLELLVPIIVSHHISGNRPLDLAMWSYIPRLFLGLISCGLIFFAPKEITTGFTVATMIFMVAHSVLSSAMFTSQMAFFARVSDPAIGGSYMTLLNTFGNLGYLWTTMASTRLVDMLTSKSEDDEVLVDGFYATSLLCSFLGFAWFFMMRKKVEKLQQSPLSAWRVNPAGRYAVKSDTSL